MRRGPRLVGTRGTPLPLRPREGFGDVAVIMTARSWLQRLRGGGVKLVTRGPSLCFLGVGVCTHNSALGLSKGSIETQAS